MKLPTNISKIITALLYRLGNVLSDLVLPDFMQGHKQLVGVCVGSCIQTGKWSKGIRVRDENGNFIKNANGKFERYPEHAAHAHTAGLFKGYICFRTEKDFQKKTTCQHELAHILTGEGHTRKWAEQYVKLGTPKWLTVEWLARKYGFEE